MFLLTEISPTIIFMANTRQKPTEEEIFEYTKDNGKFFELIDFKIDKSKNFLDQYNKK
jgi:hypothetical protein